MSYTKKAVIFFIIILVAVAVFLVKRYSTNTEQTFNTVITASYTSPNQVLVCANKVPDHDLSSPSFCFINTDFAISQLNIDTEMFNPDGCDAFFGSANITIDNLEKQSDKSLFTAELVSVNKITEQLKCTETAS